MTHPWWRDAVCYQIYVRSFADSDGDGIGDLRGITQRIDHLCDLGVDAVWLNPFYPSPQHDHGYDVSNYRDVEPDYGTLADFDDLLTAATARGIKVIVDVVPNHSSADHPWFQAALAAGPGSPERERYIFREGKAGGPPNNWQSCFGGPAWTQVPDGQWYLHLFDTSQPDLNWEHPDVAADFEKTLRFWLDRGAAGFRIDVAHSLFKAAGLPDVGDASGAATGLVVGAPMWDQPEVHDVYRRWHQILAEYDGDRMAVGEVWTPTAEQVARYVRPDELQQSFNFHWLLADWSAEFFAQVIEQTFATLNPVGASATWVLNNHDVQRSVTRYGGGAKGLARSRAATLTMLALPGSAYIYMGEELGLAQVDVPESQRQDPEFLNGRGPGRDGCRVPIPWAGSEPPYDFGPGDAQPWLPQPIDWAPMTVAAQSASADSTLAFYRCALQARRGLDADVRQVEMVAAPDQVLAFRRGDVEVWLNCGKTSVPLPEGEIVVASGQVTGDLPRDTAVWLRRQL